MLQRYLRVLVRLVPRHMRNRLGSDLNQFWLAQAHEDRYAGFAGRFRFVISVAVDALVLSLKGRVPGVRQSAGSSRRDHRSRSIAVLQDVRFGFRLMRRAPLYSSVAAGTLALGIGATTSVFAVLWGVVGQPLSFHAPEQLVSISRARENSVTDAIAWPDFRDWRSQSRSFSGMAAYTEAGATLQSEGQAEALNGFQVTHDLFQVLGVLPLLGRSFTQEEMAFNGPEAVILSHALWSERFGSDPGLLGRTLVLDGEAVPVVGVMPSGFSFPTADVQYWMPLHEDRVLQEVGLPTGGRSLAFLSVVARLGPEVSIDRARTSLVDLVRRIDEVEGMTREDYSVSVVGLQDLIVGDVRSTLLFVFGAVALVLLVACSNVAGLSLGRAATRVREMGLRLALGASRSRVIRQILVENAVLSFVAGVFGMGIAIVLIRFAVRLAPPGLPRIEEVGVSLEVLGFGLGATLLSGLLMGAAPAVKLLMGRGASGLGDSRSATASRGGLRVQQLLVVGQVGLAVVLLIGASLLARSYARLSGVRRGFESEGRVVALVVPDFPEEAEAQRVDAFYTELLARVRQLPGVISATSTYSPPFSGNGFRVSVGRIDEPEDGDDRTWIESIIVRDNYFATMGIPLLAGRDFEGGDRLESTPVVIVNEKLAELFWPGQDPLGKQLVHTGGVAGSLSSFDRAFFPRAYTVVGVVGDTRDRNLGQPPEPTWYRPHAQMTWETQYLVAAIEPGTPSIAGPLREAVWAIDPTVPVQTIRTLRSQMLETVALPRFRALFFVSFAGIAFLLAAVGIYSVIALSVARRRREIGIRMALGADGRRVLWQILWSGGRITILGTMMGMLASLMLVRLFTSMLYEITPADPMTYLMVIVMVSTVSVVASILPAIRAARVDPVRAMHQE